MNNNKTGLGFWPTFLFAFESIALFPALVVAFLVYWLVKPLKKADAIVDFAVQTRLTYSFSVIIWGALYYLLAI
jgi:hypothetical protein